MTDRADFARRLGAALARRLYPNSGLRPTDLARAIQVTPEAVAGWAYGRHACGGPQLVELIRFFDVGFANEVLGGAGVTIAKLGGRRPAIDGVGAGLKPAPTAADESEDAA